MGSTPLPSVRLKNFKLHEERTIEAAPITVFIGPNNSGKSSIFQALLALRQAAARRSSQLLQPAERRPTTLDQPYQYPSDEVVSFGEFKDIVRHGQRELVIAVAGTFYSRRLQPDYVGTLEINFDLYVRDSVPVAHSGHPKLSYGDFDWRWLPVRQVSP